MKPCWTYDPVANCGYLQVRKGRPIYGVETQPGVVTEYGRFGRVVGYQIIGVAHPGRAITTASNCFIGYPTTPKAPNR